MLFWKEWREGLLGLPYVSCPKSALFTQYLRWCEHTNEFKKRDRDFSAELRRQLTESRQDITLTGHVADRRTCRLWVTDYDAALQFKPGYVEHLERQCKRFIQACDSRQNNPAEA